MPIDARKSKSDIIKELIHKWEKTGKIGTSSPETKEEALKQAQAIAYSAKKNEASSGNSILGDARREWIKNDNKYKDTKFRCKSCGHVNEPGNYQSCDKCSGEDFEHETPEKEPLLNRIGNLARKITGK